MTAENGGKDSINFTLKVDIAVVIASTIDGEVPLFNQKNTKKQNIAIWTRPL